VGERFFYDWRRNSNVMVVTVRENMLECLVRSYPEVFNKHYSGLRSIEVAVLLVGKRIR